MALTLYLLWVVVYTYCATLAEKEEVYKQVEQKLGSAALTVPLLLPSAFHHKNMGAGELTQQQDTANRLRLSQYTDNNDVTYVYTLIEKDNKVYFTSSSATPDERETETGISYYYDLYDDVDPRVLDIFKVPKKRFIEYTDQWGTFRSVYIPIYNPDGSFYLAAADLSVTHIAERVNQTIYQSLFVAFTSLLLIYPLYLIVINRKKELLIGLDKKVQQQSLALDISQMRLKQALHSANQTWFEVNLKDNQIKMSDDKGLFGFDNNGDTLSIPRWYRNIHPDDRKATIERFNYGSQTRGPIAEEYRIKINDSWIWLSTSAETVQWDENNQPLTIVGINTNITHRKLADKKLRENEIRLRLSQESGGVCTWEHDFIKNESIYTHNC